MRILVDMNLSPRWIDDLVAAGFAAEHWSTVGPARASDIEIMEHARRNDLVVLTHDLDFGAVLAVTKGAKPSVVQLRSDDVAPEVIGPQVIEALTKMREELLSGALLSVSPGRNRISLLPLRRDDP